MRWGTVPGRVLLLVLVSLLTLVACSVAPRPPVATLPPASASAEPSAAPKAAQTMVTPPAVDAPAREPTTVRMEQSDGERWRAVTPMDSFVPPGPAVLRFTFSRPPRQVEVEQALKAAQATPVRGLMQWADERTLVWQIAGLPGRLDFYLGTAHDQEGALLSGSLPSLQVGEPPTLVLLDLASGKEQWLMTLPPDLIAATLTENGTYVDLIAWEPGSTRWDWHVVRHYIDLSSGKLEVGPAPAAQLRLATPLKVWVTSPTAAIVAGFTAGGRDLVIEDGWNGRSQVYRDFVQRAPSAPPDRTPQVAWSADGRQVAAISAGGANGADLVALDPATGSRRVIANGLPISDAASLAWSGDGRTVLVGNLLVDTGTGRVQPIEGVGDKARGFWETSGSRCLFSPEGDWGAMLLLGQGGEVLQRLGNGWPLGWAGPGKLYLVRWRSSGSRYQPPGE